MLWPVVPLAGHNNNWQQNQSLTCCNFSRIYYSVGSSGGVKPSQTPFMMFFDMVASPLRGTLKLSITSSSPEQVNQQCQHSRGNTDPGVSENLRGLRPRPYGPNRVSNGIQRQYSRQCVVDFRLHASQYGARRLAIPGEQGDIGSVDTEDDSFGNRAQERKSERNKYIREQKCHMAGL